VTSVDIAPTIYELLGLPAPTSLDGRSLASAVRGEALTSRPAFAETELTLGENPGLPPALHFPSPTLGQLLEIDTDHGNHIVVRKPMIGPTLMTRHRMVRDERWKLLYMPTPRGVTYQLFDTETDPDELTDVSSRFPGELARLRPVLWGWMLSDPLMDRDGAFLVPKGTRGPAPTP
jgi:arylsulfatase A-like enzyme